MKKLLVLVCAGAMAQVPYERIVKSAAEPHNWLTYSGNYWGHRYSPLDQINATNAGNLKVKWAYQFREPRTEVSPIVVDNVMYVTASNRVAALDARTGR